MKGADAEIVIQRARERFPQGRPQVMSDNGPQFVAKDFKAFIRLWQTSYAFCSAHYPQSNSEHERYHRTLKEQAIRAKTQLTLADAKRVTNDFIEHYNNTRLHSEIGYITSHDRLANRRLLIFAGHDKKLETACEIRKIRRRQTTALAA